MVSYSAAISLSQSYGVAGQTIYISGTGFLPNTALGGTWDGYRLGLLPPWSVTDASGSISQGLNFVVPSATLGNHSVRIMTGNDVYVDTTFIISAPALSFSSSEVPSAGAVPGATITIIGTNFDANNGVAIFSDSKKIAGAQTDLNGSFTCNFKIPDTFMSGGPYILIAKTSDYATAQLEISVGTPKLMVTPTETSKGERLTLSGENFKSNSKIGLKLNNENLVTETPVLANIEGSFSTTFLVPDSAAQGSNAIYAMIGNQQVTSTSFTVTGPVITLHPSGDVEDPVIIGSIFTIIGKNTRVNIPIYVFLDNEQLSFRGADYFSDSLGNFTIRFIFPEVDRSPVTLTIQIGEKESFTKNIAVAFAQK